MSSDEDTSRKRRASASPTGSASSRVSKTASKIKKGIQKGVDRTVSFFRRSLSRSRSHSRSPPASAAPSRATSSYAGDDFPSLKSASSDASSFYFNGRGHHDEDDEDDDEESSRQPQPSRSSVRRQPSTSSFASGSSINPLDISSSESDGNGDAGDAHPEDNQSHRPRGRPVRVEKRGGARRASPVKKASRANTGKDKEHTPSSSPPPRRSGRASRPTEKAGQATSSTSAAAKATRKKKKSPPRSSTQRARKKTKTTHNVDISAIPKADNIADDSSDAEIPEKKKRAPARHSPMYGFYHPESKIKYKDTDRAKHVPHEMFKCCMCDTWVGRNMTTQDKTSTSGLRLHAEGCYGVEAVRAARDGNDLDATRDLVNKAGKQKQGVLTGLFKRLVDKGKEIYATMPLTNAETRAECVRWCAESYRPFKVVADRAFHKLMKTGRPSTYIPHPTTVSRDTKTLFAKTRRRLAKKFKALRCRFHIALDAWTSPNHKAFVAYTVHWEENGERMSTVLDFRELGESHTGEALAILTKAVLEEFGLDQKILSVTCDNASPNDVMMERLLDALPGFGGPRARTRCFAHIVNLIAKSLLRLFIEPPKKRANKKDGDDDEAAATAAAVGKEDASEQDDLLARLAELEATSEADDPNDVYDAFADMTEADKAKFQADTKVIASALRKIRTISFKIINSSTILLPRWKAVLAEFGLPAKILPRDVSTRWNSTYDMLTAALKYKRAIRELTGEDTLSSYHLNAAEWTALENLVDVLGAFKDATTYFSRADANLATVIPAMDKLDAMLASAIIKKRNQDDVVLAGPMKAALLVAKDTLNRYYNLSDESELYRIALMLHPKYKTGYFDDHDWPEEWKDSANVLIRRVFQEYLSAYEEAGEAPKTSTTTTASAQASSSRTKTSNMFSDDEEPIIAAPITESSNELERYLAADRENVKDVVAWWEKNQRKYPVLSRMALDYLSIPPTSVPVERIFSQARILISHVRNRLSAQTARALVCLGAWSRDGLVDDGDITAVTKTPIVKDEIGDEDEDILMPADYDAISRT